MQCIEIYPVITTWAIFPQRCKVVVKCRPMWDCKVLNKRTDVVTNILLWTQSLETGYPEFKPYANNSQLIKSTTPNELTPDENKVI